MAATLDKILPFFELMHGAVPLEMFLCDDVRNKSTTKYDLFPFKTTDVIAS